MGVRRREASGKLKLVELAAWVNCLAILFFAMSHRLLKVFSVGFNFTVSNVIGVIGGDAASIYRRKTIHIILTFIIDALLTPPCLLVLKS